MLSHGFWVLMRCYTAFLKGVKKGLAVLLRFNWSGLNPEGFLSAN